jgi:hypothetical protein
MLVAARSDGLSYTPFLLRHQFGNNVALGAQSVVASATTLSKAQNNMYLVVVIDSVPAGDDATIH